MKKKEISLARENSYEQRIEVVRIIRSTLAGKLFYARSNGRITHPENPVCDRDERLPPLILETMHSRTF